MVIVRIGLNNSLTFQKKRIKENTKLNIIVPYTLNIQNKKLSIPQIQSKFK